MILKDQFCNYTSTWNLCDRLAHALGSIHFKLAGLLRLVTAICLCHRPACTSRNFCLSEAHLWQGTLALASLRKPFCCSLACHKESWPLSALGEVYAKCNAGQWEFPCSRACRMYSKVEILFLPLPSDKRWLQCPLQLSNLIIPVVQLLLSLNCSNVPSHSKANQTELNDFHPLSFVALSRDFHSQ